MNLLRLNTIGKKLYFIAGLMVFSLFFIFLVSNTTLKAIGTTGDVGRMERTFSVNFYKAMSNLKDYIRTENEGFFKKADEHLKVTIEYGTAFSTLTNDLNTISSNQHADKLANIFIELNNKRAENLIFIATYISSNQYFAKLLSISTDALATAKKLKILADRYKNADNKKEKNRILNDISKTEKQMAEIVDVFSQTTGDMAVWATSLASTVLILLILILCISLFSILFFISKSISKSAIQILDVTEHISRGDLTKDIDIIRNDELGSIGKNIKTMSMNLSSMFMDINNKIKALDDSSKELSDISGTMSTGADELSQKSSTMAAAAEEMSTNMNSVAAASEEASTNVGLVSSATEEMTSVINEIAQKSETARQISQKAVIITNESSAKIDELGKAANEIGKVTESISEISEQTNLLALNATIEAARAGEAGKGFAVVAGEIKELAKATNSSTLEIKTKIEAIQGSVKTTVTGIKEISSVMTDISEIIDTIATAVEEQSVSTKNIAENVEQASAGIDEVNSNVNQSASVAQEVAKDVSELSQVANEMSNSSSQVNLSTENLNIIGTDLKNQIDKFKIKDSSKILR